MSKYKGSNVVQVVQGRDMSKSSLENSTGNTEAERLSRGAEYYQKVMMEIGAESLPVSDEWDIISARGSIKGVKCG